MKLASYNDGSRDGQLVVVSRDLKTAHYATGAATRMRHLLDDWGFVSPQLQDIYDALNQGHGRLRHAFPFEPARCAAPLPRAGLWVRRAGHIDGDEISEGSQNSASGPAPLLCFGPADPLLGAHDPIVVDDETSAIRASMLWAAILGDVPCGASRGAALEGVRLLALVCESRLHDGSLLGTAFAPVVVTPDEPGVAWQAGRPGMRFECLLGNETSSSQADASAGTSRGRNEAPSQSSLGDTIAALARHRGVGAGAIVGVGIDVDVGVSADRRSVPMRIGDRIRLTGRTDDGADVFGTIDQQVATTASVVTP